MTGYLDTSFLASLYTEDANTTAAASELLGAGGPYVLTEFTAFEMTNAYAGRRFRREISRETGAAALAAFRQDIASGVLAVLPVPAGAFERAAALAELHTPRLGCRALDVLHVAIAQELNASLLYTFDRRQARLARTVGISVRPRLRH